MVAAAAAAERVQRYVGVTSIRSSGERGKQESIHLELREKERERRR